MKDLGYKRTPTDAKMRVTMINGSRWDVPVQLIADSRDEYYASDKEDTVGAIRAGELDAYEIKDWAANSMNWDEVQEQAVCVFAAPPVDYQEGWSNGDKEIVGEI